MYFNETYHSYSLPGIYDTDDILSYWFRDQDHRQHIACKVLYTDEFQPFSPTSADCCMLGWTTSFTGECI